MTLVEVAKNCIELFEKDNNDIQYLREHVKMSMMRWIFKPDEKEIDEAIEKALSTYKK